jgi:MFS family permease
MRQRDIGALIVGIVLGLLSTYFVLVAAAGFGHVGIFIIGCMLSPLIVGSLASRRVVLLGLVPNLLMTLCLTVYLVFFSPDLHGWYDILYVVFVMLAVGVFLALLVSVPIHLLRKRLDKHDQVQHVFSREN